MDGFYGGRKFYASNGTHIDVHAHDLEMVLCFYFL